MLHDAFWLDVQVQMPRKLHIGLVIKFIGYLANKLIKYKIDKTCIDK